jgi:hypothetical protein
VGHLSKATIKNIGKNQKINSTFPPTAESRWAFPALSRKFVVSAGARRSILYQEQKVVRLKRDSCLLLKRNSAPLDIGF